MEPLFDYSKKILDFLTLLQVEQAKGNSDLFDAAVWQDLTKLNSLLDPANDPSEIGDAILDWCEQHPKINKALNQTDWDKKRCDMDDECDGEITPPLPSNEADSIHNTYEIQKIIKAKQDKNLQNDSKS